MTRYKSVLDLPPHLRQQPQVRELLTPKQAANEPGFQARRKYGNIPVEQDGQKFPSKAQAKRNRELRIQTACGAIFGHVSEVSVRLPSGKRMRLDELVNEPATYVCRNCGTENLSRTLVLEDTKGMVTKEWAQKCAELEAALGVAIRVIHR